MTTFQPNLIRWWIFSIGSLLLTSGCLPISNPGRSPLATAEVTVPVAAEATVEAEAEIDAALNLGGLSTDTSLEAGRDLTLEGDSISLWLAIAALALVPLAYPLQRRYRKWRQNGNGDRGWSMSYSEWGSGVAAPTLLTGRANGSARQSQSHAGTPSSPSTK